MRELSDVVPMRLRDVDPAVNAVTGDVVDAAIRVQRALGSGLLEKPYELALAHELELRGRVTRAQVPLTFSYRGRTIPHAYYLDLLVDDQVVVEIKAVDALHAEHLAQLATYLRLGGYRVGLLINFRAAPLKTGIHRVVC